MTKTFLRLTELTAGKARRHRGGGGGAWGAHAAPQEPKSPPDGIVGDGRIDNFSAFPAI